MSKDDKDSEVEIINPPNILKEKIGNGGLPQQLIERAQEFINENDIDYSPFATENIETIENALTKLKQEENIAQKKKLLDKIIENIMHIKAHGGMFGYSIMSEISGSALTFLEATDSFNKDLYQIIEAHNHSITLIIKHSLKGNGGDQGQSLLKEFQSVTTRYQKKYNDEDK